MPRIALVTNTAAGVPPEQIARDGITQVPMQINFLDGHHDESSGLSTEEFYARLLREEVVPSTSPPSVGRYARIFHTLAANHEIILSIHISQALSGSYRNALAATEQVSQAKIYLHDSGSVTLGTGLQVLTAARLIVEKRMALTSPSSKFVSPPKSVTTVGVHALMFRGLASTSRLE